MQSTVTEKPKDSEADRQPLVQVQELSRSIKSDGQETVILESISFEVQRRALFAVNGPSGSGKSTLLNLLTGIDRPTSGHVTFGGEKVGAKSEDQLARWRGRNVGIVFQFFQLIPTLTALENVTLALELGGAHRFARKLWRERGLECLRTAGIAELADRLPSAVSGGQQQRIAIARAIANDPPAIVADEPTGNLDSRSAAQVFETLAGLVDLGKTVIYVTHDAQLAARASAGIELLDGRIVARHP